MNPRGMASMEDDEVPSLDPSALAEDDGLQMDEMAETIAFLEELFEHASRQDVEGLGKKYAPPPPEPEAPADVSAEAPVDAEPSPEELEALLAGG